MPRPDPADAPKSSNVTWHGGEISRKHRADLLNQRGCTLWFTGLSGSGKSTLAVALEKALHDRGHLTYRLDGDNIRHGLNANLGFSADDRVENIRRIGEVAKLFADAGLVTLTSFISPYRSSRDAVRRVHEEAGLAFLEIHVACPLEEAERRDPKGLYKKARAGEIQDFTGIDAPFEAPDAPQLRIDTSEVAIDEAMSQLLAMLQARGVFTPRAEA